MTDIDNTLLTLGDLKAIASDAYRNNVIGRADPLGAAVQRFENELKVVELASQTPYIKVRFRSSSSGGQAPGKTYKLASGRAKVGDAVTVTSSASFGAVAIVREIDVSKPPMYRGYASTLGAAVLIDPADRERIEKALGKIG